MVSQLIKDLKGLGKTPKLQIADTGASIVNDCFNQNRLKFCKSLDKEFSKMKFEVKNESKSGHKQKTTEFIMKPQQIQI